ncbi:phospho-sugar mutase [Chryseotalea sanaruensis]|uniref:Phospho-sugar mutase n=1 Tax=Chryseotalea sanaruensis TaxID=2482724 RepID=A0A401U6R9_9BACT|nr:phospho-sugar mutase [Chryseotalea sanaruensis]GCC50569.1 phospho-sugar mutase [Chryseotalea sanaruensis]
MALSKEVQDRIDLWLNSPIVDEASKNDIKKLQSEGKEKELTDSFYKDLEFGTGGLRGIMGAGSNCMNQYTLGKATQGLANYLNKTYPNSPIKVAIAYDNRNNSKIFAQITANIFSANNIQVFLYDELRPTPLLSYTIRHLQCQSGVVITASHNPKEYNGYKVYWSDGAQVVPPHDKNIIAEVNAISTFEQIKFNSNPSLIHSVEQAVEQAYYEEVKKLIPKKEAIAKHHNMPIVYTSIHGSGITMVPECLKQIGFTNVQVVAEQAIPDGNFPTVHSPNPEEQAAMEMVIKKGIALNADMVMATDPDTDRVGIGVRKPSGDFVLLNGNQAFSLMMWFILKNQQSTTNAYIAKTIVTSELVDEMAQQLNVKCYNTLTGFKYIAEVMKQQEGKLRFIAAGEESYGYMVGDFVRDKDAVSACAFFAAMAAAAKDEGKTIYDWLIQMYVEFGYYKESLITLTKKGQEGEQAIKAMMAKFRSEAPTSMAGIDVVSALDYLSLKERNLKTGEEKILAFHKSDVLQYYLADGTKVSVRPSGTEPKIKFYISVKTQLADSKAYENVSQSLDAKLKTIESYLLSL